MISGFFGQYDRPFVEATVISEEIELEANVLFLIDTGADVTCLHYPDIDDMGVDQRLVVEHGKEVHFGGIGGLAKYHAVDATIKFEKSVGKEIRMIPRPQSEPR